MEEGNFSRGLNLIVTLNLRNNSKLSKPLSTNQSINYQVNVRYVYTNKNSEVLYAVCMLFRTNDASVGSAVHVKL